MLEFNATFIISIISFVVFIFIMNAIFYNPILNIIRKRDTYIEDNISSAKEFEKQIENYKEEIDNKISEENTKSRELVYKLIEKAKKSAADKINTNRLAADSKIQIKKEELKTSEQEITNELNNNYVDELSDFVIAKVMKE